MNLRPALCKLASPAKCGIQRNVSRSDEENQAGGEDEGQGNRSTIIENLIPDRAIQQENPTCGRDRGNMYSGKPLERKRTVRITFPHREKSMFGPTFRTASCSGKPPTVKISQISTITNTARNNCISLVTELASVQPYSRIFSFPYLLPTAAFFLSDLHIRNSEASIEKKARIIEPARISLVTTLLI